PSLTLFPYTTLFRSEGSDLPREMVLLHGVLSIGQAEETPDDLPELLSGPGEKLAAGQKPHLHQNPRKRGAGLRGFPSEIELLALQLSLPDQDGRQVIPRIVGGGQGDL